MCIRDSLEFDSARDSNGHGSHTSSTAAGNAGVEASILGTNFGMISGIAPRAHVIMYRVCGGPTGSCYASDSAAAVEQAILDGVDVLNFSIGGGTNPYSDIVSLAFRSAFENGVFVACSAGNSGPGADTTGHREPTRLQASRPRPARRQATGPAAPPTPTTAPPPAGRRAPAEVGGRDAAEVVVGLVGAGDVDAPAQDLVGAGLLAIQQTQLGPHRVDGAAMHVAAVDRRDDGVVRRRRPAAAAGRGRPDRARREQQG